MLFILSCTGGKGGAASDRALPEPGVIHAGMKCLEDPGTSYAIYIPTAGTFPDYSTETLPAPPETWRITRDVNGDRKYPVMIVFDPHADGMLPVKKYSTLAEKYGFILLGSCDSKNGMTGEATGQIARALLNEALKYYPADTARIYLLGFSGGARVASMAAMTDPLIKGVICCGAGIGRSQMNITHIPDYYGVAGTGDFNMSEMVQLDGPMAAAGFRFFITTFPGIHAWPPEDVIEDGLVWHIGNSVRDGVLAKSPDYLSGLAAAFGARIESLKTQGLLLPAAGEYRKVVSILQGLAPVGSFIDSLSSLERDSAYLQRVHYQTLVLKREMEEQEELVRALQKENLSWWKTQILKCKENEEHQARGEKWKYTEDTLKNRRLLSFLGLICYMNASALVAQHDETGAEKAIGIYALAEPGNPEPEYLKAILLARRPDTAAAIGRLRVAVSKGFDDKMRMNAQPEFGNLKGSAGWQELMKSMDH